MNPTKKQPAARLKKLLMSIDHATLQANAIRLLAAREHSRHELRQKFRTKTTDQQSIESVLDDLEQQGLLSDERFTEQYIEMRSRKGYGPVRIRMELAKRGIHGDMINAWLDDDPDIWFDRLQTIAERKYPHAMTTDQREQSRRARFLYARGYPGSLIRRYLSG